MANLVVWFDIPVLDMNRAKRFYENVLDCAIELKPVDGAKVGILNCGERGIQGCLWETQDECPSSSGIIVYFSVQGRLEQALRKVPKLGGRVIRELHAIGAYGYRGIVRDSEGNRVALHST